MSSVKYYIFSYYYGKELIKTDKAHTHSDYLHLLSANKELYEVVITPIYVK